MIQPGRKYSAGDGYRYGFNGKENDNEVKGEGNQQDYGMRIYDPRLGRFLSVDPLIAEYPWYTPYQFAGNKPIVYIDLDGLEEGPTKLSYNGHNFNFDPTKTKREIEQQSAEHGRAYTKNVLIGIGVGAAVATDVVLTGGRITTYTAEFYFGARLLGSIHHNRSNDPSITEEHNQEFKQAATEVIIGWGVGKIIGTSVKMFLAPTREPEQINYFFRGTTRGWPGNKSSQITPATSTSSDPAVATIFSVNAKQKGGEGIIEIALPKDYQGIMVTANKFEGREAEFALKMTPTQFSERVNMTITSEESRQILKGMGINIPARVGDGAEMDRVLLQTPKLTKSQINEYYQKVTELVKSKKGN